YRYHATLCDDNELIAKQLIELTEENSDWGFGLGFSYLRHVENHCWNHKRVYRIYWELALNLRIKPRRRLKRHAPEPLTDPIREN
ncbi:IS3 family transposase, partial [Acinetobacter johnsonii]